MHGRTSAKFPACQRIPRKLALNASTSAKKKTSILNQLSGLFPMSSRPLTGAYQPDVARGGIAHQYFTESSNRGEIVTSLEAGCTDGAMVLGDKWKIMAVLGVRNNTQ